MGPGGKLLRNIARAAMLLLLGAWIGSMVFFGAVTAPAAFAALAVAPNGGSHLAGGVVRIALGELDVAAFVLAPLSIVALLLGESRERRTRGVVAISVALLVSIGLVSVVSHGVITVRLDELRSLMGVIGNVPLTDATRLEFDRLHKLSVLLFGYQVVAALVVYVLASIRWFRLGPNDWHTRAT